MQAGQDLRLTFVLQPYPDASPFSHRVAGNEHHRVVHHRRERHDEGLFVLLHYDVHIREGAGFDLPMWVFADNLSRECFARGIGTRIHPGHPSLKPLARQIFELKESFLPLLNQIDLGRWNVDGNFYLGRISQGQHAGAASRKTHHRVHHIPHFAPLPGDHPVERGRHDRNLELVLGEVQIGLRLLKLRFRGLDRELRLIVLLLSHGALFVKLGNSLKFLAGVLEIGLRNGKRGLRLLKLEFFRPRVEFGQDLAFPHTIPLFDVAREAAGAKGRVKPNFSEYHVVKALLIIYEEEPVGRQVLSRRLGLGEASTRTLIRRLRELGIVTVDPVGGCVLTEKGRECVGSFLLRVRIIGDMSGSIKGRLRISECSYGVVVKGYSSAVGPGTVTKLRDLIVKHGADGALVLSVRNGKFYMPGPGGGVGEDEIPELRDVRGGITGVGEGDLILVSFGGDLEECERALIGALLDLLGASLTPDRK